jgi:regulatory protein
MLKKNTKTYTLEEAKRSLEHYCVYQERSYSEIAQKLQNMGMILEARDEVLLHLIQHDFVNEERFARSFVSGKFNIKKWGKLKIKRALFQKGISKKNIEIGFSEIDYDAYIKVLKELAEKKNSLIKETNKYKKRQKLLSYLQQKGFEINLVYEYVFLDK